MWSWLLEIAKQLWHGKPERIGPVIEGYTGAMSEWRRLYREILERLEIAETRLSECEEDRKELHERIEILEQRTA